jgi:hypothetical protein
MRDGFPWFGLVISALLVIGFIVIAVVNGTGSCT